jgi:nucleotide-binding universal stress UspA family protein
MQLVHRTRQAYLVMTSVVVGVDGSAGAIHATQWAVDEAVSRDSPLRLIYILERHSEAVRLETEYAETVLRVASAAVEATGQPVKIETAIIRGHPNAVLARQSRDAEILVVGAFGAGHRTRKLIGSTAAALVRLARCPLAVIRPPYVPPAEPGAIAVLAEGSQQYDALLRMAMDEARLRKLALLTLCVRPLDPDGAGSDLFGQSLRHWRHHYPEVAVDVVTVGTSAAQFLSETDRTVRLVIVGGNDGEDRTRGTLAAGGRSVLFHAHCSVLLVHPTPR